MGAFSRTNWVSRRYRLPSFDSGAFEAGLRDWIQPLGFSITGQYKFDLFQRLSANSYTLAKSWWQTLVKKPNLYVGHRENILYVFSTSELPQELSDIFDQFLAPFVSENGGESINETPIAFATSILAVSPLSYLLNRLKVDYSLQVKINPQVQKVEAATEEVRVPPGVSVTIKRSRTVKHSVEIKKVTTRGRALEAGIKLPSIDILKASIKTEVQKQSGSSWEESETIDYQVNLSGDKSPAYRLLWTDLMRVGTVENIRAIRPVFSPSVVVKQHRWTLLLLGQPPRSQH